AQQADVISKDFHAKDLYAPEVIANPYPYYDALRDKPIQFGLEDYPPGTMPGLDKPHPAWVVLKHADVRDVCRRAKVFSSRDIMQEQSEAPTLMLVNHDDPRHAELRAIAQMAFTPKRVVEDIAPWMANTVDQQLDEFANGDVDFMENLAPNLPALVMTKLIGLPGEDYALLRRWANAFMVTSDFTLEERQQCNIDLWSYFSDAVASQYDAIEQGREVTDNLMSAFIQAESEGAKLTKEEVVRFCLTLVVAGAETTGYLLGKIIETLITEEGLLDQLRADRSLVRPFIEESLRRDGPVQRLHRVCVEDTLVGDTKIKAGDWVAIFHASANRDPEVFENPNAFILNRPNAGKHVTFGYGIHHCMGSGVARAEAAAMINGILDRFSQIEPAGERIRQRGGLLNYGLESCPIRLIA
ncbi:MAG: cytochrome P450, partial [Hyphomonadaceae bacterium]|nr:cytochrome P450 [Hyphomonadaceae bacterium]